MKPEPVTLQVLVELPVEIQAEYSTDICRQLVSNPSFIENQVQTIQSDEGKNDDYFQQWRVSSVGNMAYCSLHVMREEDRRVFSMALAEYIAWYKAKNKAKKKKALRDCSIYTCAIS